MKYLQQKSYETLSVVRSDIKLVDSRNGRVDIVVPDIGAGVMRIVYFRTSDQFESFVLEQTKVNEQRQKKYEDELKKRQDELEKYR